MSLDPAITTAQTSTPFIEGGPHAKAHAMPDGWNVNVHFLAGDEVRTYVFDTEQAQRFIDSLLRALSSAQLARRTP